MPQRMQRGDNRRPAAGGACSSLYDPRSDMPATQFSMKYSEAAGL